MHMHTLKMAIVERAPRPDVRQPGQGDARAAAADAGAAAEGRAGAVRAEPPGARDPAADRPRAPLLPARPRRLGTMRDFERVDRPRSAGTPLDTGRAALGDPPRARGSPTARSASSARSTTPLADGTRRQRDARQHHGHPLRRAGPRHSSRDADDDTVAVRRAAGWCVERAARRHPQIALLPAAAAEHLAGRGLACCATAEQRDRVSPCRSRTRRGSRSTAR